MASGDEFVRAALFGSEKLPSNDATDGSADGDLWRRLHTFAVTPPPTRADAWTNWLASGQAVAAQLQAVVDQSMAAAATAGYQDQSVALATTVSRLDAGAAVLGATSWSVTTSAVTWGGTPVHTSRTATLTVRNTSAERNIKLGGAKLTGAAAADWSVRNNCPTTIAAGATCTVTVTAIPSANGVRKAMLTLSMSPATTGPTLIPLSVTGV